MERCYIEDLIEMSMIQKSNGCMEECSPTQQTFMPTLPPDLPQVTAKEKSFRERLSGIVLTIVVGGSITACIVWAAFLAWMLFRVTIGLLF